jgi:hypothetical protein
LDFHHDGASAWIFAAAFAEGAPTVINRSSIRDGIPLYMRVKRNGDQWEQSYSYDKRDWLTNASFTHVLSVSAVGVFAGNAGPASGTSGTPAHTGLIDYFANTASSAIDLRPPVISNIRIARGSDFAIMRWTTDEPATSTDIPLSISAAAEAPTRLELHQNYPNPFNPESTIEFSLPEPGFVTMRVFTIKGEEVAVLVKDQLPAGRYKFRWNANEIPSGVYFYSLSMALPGQTAPKTATKKLLLVK